MKKSYKIGAAILLVAMAAGAACLFFTRGAEKGQIYLYGERHNEAEILEEEFELWNDYYHDDGMRHLFVELPYYTAEYLNLWMQEDDDTILEEIYGEKPEVKLDFYRKIKEECPETIFHGTDVGHQSQTIGQRYLQDLESKQMKDSEQYQIARKNIDQGVKFYREGDVVYRENKMAENFIREYDKLDGESIMGIYGAAHTGLDDMDITGEVPSMGNQIAQQYGSRVHSKDLSKRDVIRTDTIEVGGKEYEASYFGKVNTSPSYPEYQAVEFWRLEDAYDDFKDSALDDDWLSYVDIPFVVEDGQIVVADYIMADGSVVRKYFRLAGNEYRGVPVAEEFKPCEE